MRDTQFIKDVRVRSGEIGHHDVSIEDLSCNFANDVLLGEVTVPLHAVDRDLLTQLSEIYARVSAAYFSSSTAADHPEDAVTLRDTLRSVALNRSVRLVR